MLSKEQIAELKKQLLEQIKHLPADKKAQAQQQIDAMSADALESMLKDQHSQKPKNQKGVFRMIIDGELPSKVIDENKECIAVLDIKPLSKGHVIIIPRSSITSAKNISPKMFSLAKKLAKRIESKLEARSVEIQTETKFGEQIINIIPQYEKNLEERYDASGPELTDVYNKLKVNKIVKVKKQKKVPKNLPVLKRRIP